MVKKVNEKLNSNKGITILFALLFFLVASMVSITILVGAMSSFKRAHSTKEVTQANISIDSAALLLKTNIDGAEYKINTYENNGETTYGTSSLNAGHELFASEIENISRETIIGNTSCTVSNLTIKNGEDGNVTIKTSCTLNGGSNDNTVVFHLVNEESSMYLQFSLNKTVKRFGTYNEETITWKFIKASGKELSHD